MDSPFRIQNTPLNEMFGYSLLDDLLLRFGNNFENIFLKNI